MDLFRTCAALQRHTLPSHISSAHREGKDGAMVSVNASTHQKKNNKNTGKRQEKRQAIDFRET